MERPKVLITGASGLIAGLSIDAHRDKYEFSGVSRKQVDRIPSRQADVADYDAIRPAFESMDMVLHLAAQNTDSSDWEGTMQGTIRATLNVFRAAQDAGVWRVVFFSSGSVVSGHTFDVGSPYYHLVQGEYDRVPERWKMIDEHAPPRPDCAYAVGKLFGETCGRYFSDRFGLSVIVIRCGAVLRADRPEIVGHVPGFLSHADTAQIVGLSLGAPRSLKYDIFNALSDNHWSWRDTTHATEVLGFRPTGSSDGYDFPV